MDAVRLGPLVALLYRALMASVARVHSLCVAAAVSRTTAAFAAGRLRDWQRAWVHVRLGRSTRCR